jgi:molecular chaperone HtpG
MSATLERHNFQAETKELLDLMVHSIYSNKDIFLRELISNSSDALDKLKFESLTNTSLTASETPRILLMADSEKSTLTVDDNGIGMNHDELLNVIGTIAKSGTREFMGALKDAKQQDSIIPPELIGQFGVGFYSTFMVADRVVVETRKAGETQGWRWESTGDGSFTIEPSELADKLEAGTRITLHLKTSDTDDGLNDYASEWTIRDIVKKYSDFVAYPIQMDVQHTDYDHDSEGKVVEGSGKTRVERETLNSMKAIWLRAESDVTDAEYQEFYKHISHDWSDPLSWFRMKMEGVFEAQALLYIPTKAPHDLYFREGKRGVQLYVKRVFIMDDCKELIPDYLRFIKGVVDSEDLNLNISREILQQNRQIKAIRSRLVKKTLATLDNLFESNREQYLAFWAEFGRLLKEGIYSDHENRETLLNLTLFQSTHSENELVSLKDYVSRLKPGQETIYFATGESRKAIEHAPHLEAFREKGYEVLLLTDPVDEIWIQNVPKYGDFAFQSVGKGTVDLGTDEEKTQREKERTEKQEEYKTLLGAIQGKLGEFVKEVRLSSRLTSSASCLVSNANDMSPQMEQIMKSMNQPIPQNKRILELNPKHPLMEKLQAQFQADQNDAALDDYAYLLYGQALLAESSPLPDPAKFSKLLGDLMAKSI